MNTTPVAHRKAVPVRLTATPEFARECDELVEWVKSFDGDVDHTAFKRAVAKIAFAAPEFHRFPRSLEGCELLDVLGCLYGTFHGRFLASLYPQLPGAKRLRDSDDNHDLF